MSLHNHREPDIEMDLGSNDAQPALSSIQSNSNEQNDDSSGQNVDTQTHPKTTARLSVKLTLHPLSASSITEDITGIANPTLPESMRMPSALLSANYGTAVRVHPNKYEPCNSCFIDADFIDADFIDISIAARDENKVTRLPPDKLLICHIKTMCSFHKSRFLRLMKGLFVKRPEVDEEPESGVSFLDTVLEYETSEGTEVVGSWSMIQTNLTRHCSCRLVPADL